jgi:hypothetical protein
MQEVIIVDPKTAGEELVHVLECCAINPHLAVIVIKPEDLTLAYKFDCDIVPLWNYTFERAYEVAVIVSTESDRLILIIGEKC